MVASASLRRLAVVLGCFGVVAATQLAPRLTQAADTTGTGGGLAVVTVDPAGTSLVGGCFELYTAAADGARGKLVPGSGLCDQATIRDTTRGAADGATDGTLGWTGLAPGGYVIHETLGVALAGTANQYELTPDTTVTVGPNAVTTRTLVFRLVGGLTIHKVDAAGQPLVGACFAITGSHSRVGAAACDGTAPATATLPAGDGKADGIIQLGGLTLDGQAATLSLSEIRAPAGYAPVGRYRVEIAPDRVTEAKIVNTTTPTVTSGGGTAGTPIIGLELQIDSAIDITKLQAQPVDNGTTTATGVISLEGDSAAGWHGTGNLTSHTEVRAALSCQVITVTGSGTYDWVVRAVHAGPSMAADAITLDMDSGPINESPDAVTTDACGQSFDSTMNTWEAFFFDAYRPRYKSAGFRVDGWVGVGGSDVWTAGGVVAEARWTGSCGSTLLLGCTDHTTFKLVAVVKGIAAPTPGPAASDSAEAAPLITPEPVENAGAASPVATLPPGPTSGGLPAGCTDFQSCFDQYAIVGIVGGIALLGGGILIWQRLSSRTPPVLTEPTLDADKTGPLSTSLQTDTLGKIEPIDADKFGTLETSLRTDTLGKLEPRDEPGLKLGDGSLGTTEPLSTNLPPPPGSSG